MNLIMIIISSALISNVVLSRFLGICPFLGVSNKVETAKGMGLAVVAVIFVSTFVTFVINKAFLEVTGFFKLDLTYLQTIVFILVIACLVQFVEMLLKKFIPSLYKSLGVYLPLITTNCAVLGVAINNKNDYAGLAFGTGYLYSVVRGFFTAIGFLIAIVILASIREKNEYNDVPESFKGTPIVLVTSSLMAIAFCGFAGLV